MTKTKLTDIQLLLLTNAASRTDGSVLPPPPEAGSRIRSAIAGLLKRALIEEVSTLEAMTVWRETSGTRFSLIINAAGRTIIGAGETPTATETAVSMPAVTTKIGMVVELMQRGGGATLIELAAATGWLPHTTRAALTGLRKKGYSIGKADREGATTYVLAA